MEIVIEGVIRVLRAIKCHSESDHDDVHRSAGSEETGKGNLQFSYPCSSSFIKTYLQSSLEQ
ncbi:hypothetical protein JBE27_57550 [Streptomyces albiflaviniger]|nr:hypothetical protein [Streptomyces albiflaviniger]